MPRAVLTCCCCSVDLFLNGRFLNFCTNHVNSDASQKSVTPDTTSNKRTVRFFLANRETVTNYNLAREAKLVINLHFC